MEFLWSLLSTDGFMPHGHCYLWEGNLVSLHVISDSLIALAYFSIPLTLLHFLRKKKDVPFNWIFLAFGIFILACGTTHVMEIWTVWNASYWLAGFIKAFTATASVSTAVALIWIVPPVPGAANTPRAGKNKSPHLGPDQDVLARSFYFGSRSFWLGLLTR